MRSLRQKRYATVCKQLVVVLSDRNLNPDSLQFASPASERLLHNFRQSRQQWRALWIIVASAEVIN